MSLQKIHTLINIINQHMCQLREELRQYERQRKYAQNFDTEIQQDSNHTLGQPKRHGFPWSSFEDFQLTRRFQQGLSIKAIAHRHDRTPVAITKRLELLGLVGTSTISEDDYEVPF